MKVAITEMHSILDALRTLYMSKRSWTQEKEDYLSRLCFSCVDWHGKPVKEARKFEEFEAECNKLFKWGQHHTTMLRFLDMSVVVEGLHRGATDDLDSHARRFDNRIIRSSTRLAEYTMDEMSEWYEGKVIPTEQALEILGLESRMPDTLVQDDKVYVKTNGGYILSELSNNRDVKRGLYRMYLPMTFTYKVSIPEWAHVYRLRGKKENGAIGTAAPELQDMVEMQQDQLEEWYPQLNRQYLLGICN